MVKIYAKSTLEVWRADYINFPQKRGREGDKDAVIVQMETSAHPGNYIVEVLREKDYTKIGGYNSEITEESEDK